MTEHPFQSLPPNPKSHFHLWYYTAILRVLEYALKVSENHPELFEKFPFLIEYNNELAGFALEGMTVESAAKWWDEALVAWEASAPVLPLVNLRGACGLDYEDLTLLMIVGLPEEEPRFAGLFESLQDPPGQRRPTARLLERLILSARDNASLRRLQTLGLVQSPNAEAPRLERTYQVPAMVWEALCGEGRLDLSGWGRLHSADSGPAVSELILPPQLEQTLKRIPALLESGEVRAVVVRGPQHNGRRTLLGAVARALGKGWLEITGLEKSTDERWRLVGLLATLLNAMPVIVLDLPPGEKFELPALEGLSGPVGIVMGRQGGLEGPRTAQALSIHLGMPDACLRRQHWADGLEGHSCAALEEITARFRMPGGNLRQAARLARAIAALDQRQEVTLEDVQQANRSLNRHILETLAQPVEASGDWSQLAAGEHVLNELAGLESRCRYRENLPKVLSGTLARKVTPGVRALFTGPSGTGKTLAACLLAARLNMELYRLDLASVVNKYIGETEKNLSQVFDRAEELDVILLLDEGDALLTQRTTVNTSNDRYANLETNYLLQRIESFEGILIVTTNAGDHIDGAFQRRMDVVVEFRVPNAAERFLIWQLHLPAEHAVGHTVLREAAERCNLTGGQIRNAVLHATLLALNDGGRITDDHLFQAVQREYRKISAVCPLRTLAIS